MNSAIYESEFPKELKDGDMSPGFKRGVTTTKVNYRLFNVLPAVSKIFERILKGQIEDSFNIFYQVYFLVSGRDIAHIIR